MSVIRHIADICRQQEYQRALALGYSFGVAIDMSWRVHGEVIEMGRMGIMERRT